MIVSRNSTAFVRFLGCQYDQVAYFTFIVNLTLFFEYHGQVVTRFLLLIHQGRQVVVSRIEASALPFNILPKYKLLFVGREREMFCLSNTIYDVYKYLFKHYVLLI